MHSPRARSCRSVFRTRDSAAHGVGRKEPPGRKSRNCPISRERHPRDVILRDYPAIAWRGCPAIAWRGQNAGGRPIPASTQGCQGCRKVNGAPRPRGAVAWHGRPGYQACTSLPGQVTGPPQLCCVRAGPGACLRRLPRLLVAWVPGCRARTSVLDTFLRRIGRQRNPLGRFDYSCRSVTPVAFLGRA